jgi:HD-like signal output (HDOD) protein
MSQKHILLADADAKTVEEFREALGQEWIVKSVVTGSAALDELKSQVYDGLVASLNLQDIETAQLLNKVRTKYPTTVRFVVASEKDRERVVKEVLGAHQFLIRPFDAEGLRTTLERALAFDRWIDNDKLHKLVARMRSLPTVPALYLEILAALRSSDTTTEEVGEMIAKDMAITTKLLQVINSAYFGLPRTVTSPSEAVGLLGFETVKSMVIAVKLLNQYDRMKLGEFSVERLWQHSTAVAHNARRLVLLQTGERTLAEEAFTAGLLHDVGKAVLAGNFTDQYQGAQSLARKQQIPMWVVEKEIFGASHGEIGAYLLGLWGLPLGVLEATALHHQPTRSANKVFAALSAVHVANVLQHEAGPDLEGDVAPKLDLEYLTEIGMVECLPAWREEILGPEAADSELVSEELDPGSSLPRPNLTSVPPPNAALFSSDEPLARSPNEIAPSSATQPDELTGVPAAPGNGNVDDVQENQGAPDIDQGQTPASSEESVQLDPGAFSQWRGPELAEPELAASGAAPAKPRQSWLTVCVVAVLGLLVAWLTLGRKTGENQKALVVRAQPIKHSLETNASKAVDITSAQSRKDSAEVMMRHGPETNAPVSPDTKISSGPAAASGSLTNADSSKQPGTEMQIIFPELKLQGILFSPLNPSAIINGILVRTNDLVLGVRITEIKRSSVIIDYQHQRKTLSLE